MEFANISEVEKGVVNSSEKKKHKIQKALNQSITEGSAASFSSGLGDSYITPFALALNANAFQIGLLSSLSSITSPLFQLFGGNLMSHKTRKKIILTFVLLQALTWIPLSLLSFFFLKDILLAYLPYALILLFITNVAMGAIAYPAWFSWMGDIVPEKDIGKYFSLRNRATGIVGLCAVLIGAFVLDAFKTKGLALIGFSILFILAFVFRFISFLIFKKTYFPEFKQDKKAYFSFPEFLKAKTQFRTYTLYEAFFSFSIMIASPFFAVYMLQDLGFNYVTFILVSMSGSVFYLLFSPLLGRFADRFGSKPLFYIATFAFALNPIFWIFLKTPLSLILVPQVLSGFANASLVMANTTLTYSLVSPQKRAIAIPYKNILVGFGSFLGALIGGFLIQTLNISFLKPILFIFLLAAVLRFLVGIFFLPKLQNQKNSKKLPPIHVSLAHPFRTLQADVGWIKYVFR